MGAKSREVEPALLRRWKKMVKSNPKLNGEVRVLASRLLSGIQLFVEERQWRLVESVIVDAASVPLTAERPVYVV